MFLNNLVPESYKFDASQTARCLSTFDYTLIAAHVNLDGDALGSLISCGCVLQALGKKFVIYSSTGIPNYLSFLKLPCDELVTSLKDLPFEPQTALYLDCSEANRLGVELEKVAFNWPSINIDHHVCDAGLGSVANFIRPESATTVQLTAYVATELGIPLQGMLADALAVGVVTDTGGFSHDNVSENVFTLCAALVHGGCSISSIREKLQSNGSIGKTRLWGVLYSRLKLYYHDKISLCPVMLADMERFNCRAEDTEGIVEEFRKIRGVEVAALLRQEPQGQWKFSLRSRGATDVRAMAAVLGGGGHKNAAGGTIGQMSVEEAEELLLQTIINGLL